jgi:hypothetical protein
LGRGYGNAVPIASDLEWYATERASVIPHGHAQHGVVMGDIETVRGVVTVPEMRSVRTHRWTKATALPPLFDSAGVAHLGRRLTFRFTGGRSGDRHPASDSSLDLVLTPNGLAQH